MNAIRFNDALRCAAEAVQDDTLPCAWPVRVVRDVYGRLRFAVDCDSSDYPVDARQRLETAQQALGRYATDGRLLFRDDFSNPDEVFGGPDWHLARIAAPTEIEPDRAIEVRVLDRQIIGQDWLRTELAAEAGHPPRIVFYGLKGGVGRSTALAMLAYRLARDGKRVLLIDFDLESPGLSGLLLPPERVAACGLVDWFVEDAVGQGDLVLGDLLSDSPLADNTSGSIRVAAAMGNGERAYMSKLARVYADVPSPDGPQRFAQRMGRIVNTLEERERPDVVLIDSRAGLHDVAAVAISRLATIALLFATDSEQSWQGYGQLFKHWNQHPQVLRAVRERLAIVQALFPETDQVERARRFLERSYELFSEHLYDDIEPGDDAQLQAFSFQPDAKDAPHFPLRVRWNARFQEFNPLMGREDGGVDDKDIELAFGPFFEQIIELIEVLRA